MTAKKATRRGECGEEKASHSGTRIFFGDPGFRCAGAGGRARAGGQAAAQPSIFLCFWPSWGLAERERSVDALDERAPSGFVCTFASISSVYVRGSTPQSRTRESRKKNCVLPAKDTTLPPPSLVPLGVARLSPSSRYRVLHEATVGPACALGVPCPVGKPSSEPGVAT